jgi:hypothetical protein
VTRKAATWVEADAINGAYGRAKPSDATLPLISQTPATMLKYLTECNRPNSTVSVVNGFELRLWFSFSISVWWRINCIPTNLGPHLGIVFLAYGFDMP